MISILGWPLLWLGPGLRLCVWLFSSLIDDWVVEESWLAHARMAGSERTCHELAKSVPVLMPLLKNSKISGIGPTPGGRRAFAGRSAAGAVHDGIARRRPATPTAQGNLRPSATVSAWRRIVPDPPFAGNRPKIGTRRPTAGGRRAFAGRPAAGAVHDGIARRHPATPTAQGNLRPSATVSAWRRMIRVPDPPFAGNRPKIGTRRPTAGGRRAFAGRPALGAVHDNTARCRPATPAAQESPRLGCWRRSEVRSRCCRSVDGQLTGKPRRAHRDALRRCTTSRQGGSVAVGVGYLVLAAAWCMSSARGRICFRPPMRSRR